MRVWSVKQKDGGREEVTADWAYVKDSCLVFTRTNGHDQFTHRVMAPGEWRDAVIAIEGDVTMFVLKADKNAADTP